MTDEHIALDVLRAKLEHAEEDLREATQETHTAEEIVDMKLDIEALRSRLASIERRRMAEYGVCDPDRFRRMVYRYEPSGKVRR